MKKSRKFLKMGIILRRGPSTLYLRTSRQEVYYHTKRNKMLNSNRVKSYWLFTLISQILWCMYIYCRLQYLLQLAMVCTKFLSIHSALNSVQRSTICSTYMALFASKFLIFFLILPIIEGERINQKSWFQPKLGE